MRRNVEIFVLSAPAILLFVCFVILPIVLGAYYGFYQWKGYGLPSKTGKFVGLQNYITALKDPAFQAAILHTFEVVIGSLVIQAPLAILFALLLNQKFKGRGLIRTPHLRAVCRFRGHRRHRMEPVATEEGAPSMRFWPTSASMVPIGWPTRKSLFGRCCC